MSERGGLSNGRAAMWATGQVAVQIYRDIPSLLLLFYMTQILVVPPAMAGVAIFVPKLFWSSACDFTVGAISDRFRDRFERRYLMLAGAALAPVGLLLLFWPVALATTEARLAHVALCFLLYVTIFSVFSVPHLSIGTELAQDQAGQSRVMAWRTALIGGGVLLSAGGAPWLIERAGGGASAYVLMAAILAAVCSAALVIAFLGSKETTRAHAPAAGESKFAVLRGNRAFRYLLGAFAVHIMGQGAAVATLTYLVVFKIAVPKPFEALAISMLITCTANTIVQPVLARTTGRFGSRNAFMVGCVLYSGALALTACAAKGSLTTFYAGAVAIGLTNPITLQALYTRLSEVIARDGAEHGGGSRAGFYSSLFVVGDKIAFALGGTLVAGSLLGAFGFRPGGAVQSPEAVTGIALIFAGVPLVCNIAAILLMAQSRWSVPTRSARLGSLVTNDLDIAENLYGNA